ncbi:phosphatase PAP2 family protein [Pseudarthrobacter sp. J1738]|uniref:phosphatase PAP2 family protein n=1 Tax=unclassified Pseudarthrobacter TaxID=2647000 RepID=UPI003D2861E7
MKAQAQKIAKWIASSMGPYSAMWLTLIIGMGIVLGLALAGAEVYEDVVESDGVASLDHPALAYAKTLRTPGLDSAVTAFTNVGGVYGMPILAVLVAALLTWKTHNWRPVILIVAAGAGSLLATVVGKKLIGRVRPATADAVPPYETSPSFPSGHTLNATVIIGVVVYLLCLEIRRNWLKVLVILAGGAFVIFMGLSRVFLGHHWLTDVMAAWALGLAWLALVILAHQLFHAVRHRHNNINNSVSPAPAE